MENGYNNFESKSDEIVSIKEWLITILIMSSIAWSSMVNRY